MSQKCCGVIFQLSYGDTGFDLAVLEQTQTKTGKFTSFIDLKRVAGQLTVNIWV